MPDTIPSNTMVNNLREAVIQSTSTASDLSKHFAVKMRDGKAILRERGSESASSSTSKKK